MTSAYNELHYFRNMAMSASVYWTALQSDLETSTYLAVRDYICKRKNEKSLWGKLFEHANHPFFACYQQTFLCKIKWWSMTTRNNKSDGSLQTVTESPCAETLFFSFFFLQMHPLVILTCFFFFFLGYYSVDRDYNDVSSQPFASDMGIAQEHPPETHHSRKDEL